MINILPFSRANQLETAVHGYYHVAVVLSFLRSQISLAVISVPLFFIHAASSTAHLAPKVGGVEISLRGKRFSWVLCVSVSLFESAEIGTREEKRRKGNLSLFSPPLLPHPFFFFFSLSLSLSRPNLRAFEFGLTFQVSLQVEVAAVVLLSFCLFVCLFLFLFFFWSCF